MSLKEEITLVVEGEVTDDKKVLDQYSRDTSLFKVEPELVVSPQNADDLKKLVHYVGEQKETQPELSITARSGGSDMTGGPLNDSIILNCTEHLNNFVIDEKKLVAMVEPGVFFRDFEKELNDNQLILPPFPASKMLCALGGMVMNNSAGEKTLRYGQMRKFVENLSMVLADGNEYTFGPLTEGELKIKMRQKNFEGIVYREMFKLLEHNYDLVHNSRPKVNKNSAGYALWEVWDRKRFDLSQLFVGSQGTLGLMTKATVRLVRDKPEQKLIALFFDSWQPLPEVVKAILPYEPETLETFDDETLKLGLRFMPEIARKAGTNLISFALRFLPEVIMGVRLMGIPKLIILVEVAEDTSALTDKKVRQIVEAIKPFPILHRVIPDEQDAEKYWIMRRESFNLLRQHVKGKKTAPFIEDFCVRPELIPEFLPKALKILKDHDIKANVAGHAGDGNFHIIPLMDLRDPKEREKILLVADKFYDLVVEYEGTITAEHNDGIMRTPYLERMYGSEVVELFERVKNIFDPLNMFNPGKKVGGTKQYLKDHITF